MAKLTLDDRDNILDMLQHPGWVAMDKLLTLCIEGREANVLRLNLNDTPDRDLVIQKARAEGARQVVADLKQQLINLRSKTGQTE